jgi:peptidoglycan L-alanyl-D-glutamate endopeptidase CwlK
MGGDWKFKDLPHFQWGPCKPSPSDRARELIRTEGMEAVWGAVGAD